MKVALKDFQTEAVHELLSRLDAARSGYRGGAGQQQAVGLTATTGAGKTIIATALIEAILFGSDEAGTDPDVGATFLWMTDKPELNSQTQAKMLDASSDLRFDLLPEVDTTFNEETLQPGRVYFLNTQKLGAKADLVKKGPLVKRAFTFWDVIRATIEDTARTLYLVVDEAHRGMTETKKIEEANSIIQRFIKGYPSGGMPAAPIVLGISATPERFMRVVENSNRTTSRWDVPADQVRASGLIKDETLADFSAGRRKDAMALFADAVKVWKSSTEQWAAYHATYGEDGEDPLIVPALIIQVENESGGRVTATNLDSLIRIVVRIAGRMEDKAFAHAFGTAAPEPAGQRVIRYIEPSRIANDSDARVVFFKSSLDTGWDCPRAEVMFSFRRAVDPVSIAQTIGRMVRTPLARRIEENDELNSAYVFLPYYEEAGVQTIISHLSDSGNEAIAGTVKPRRASVSLPLRTDMSGAIEVIEKVPSYLVPTPRARPEIRTLADLGNFLSGTGIDADAFRHEMLGVARLLLQKREALADDADFEREVSDQGEILVRRAELVLDATGSMGGGTRTLQATEESISRLFTSAARRLTNEAASWYVRLRLENDPASISLARREAFSLSARDDVTEAVNTLASKRIDTLRGKHVEQIGTLSPSKQARYKAILRQVPEPTPIELHLPEMVTFPRGRNCPAGHIYADGKDAPIYLNGWEEDTIGPEAVKSTTVGWLRNGEREGWAFCVPWRDRNVWRGFFPDFLLVRRDGSHLVVDILDPHDHSKLDAVGKAQGLSQYAAKHAEEVGHADLIAKIGQHYRRLHLEQLAIRKEVDAISTPAELLNLYKRKG
ncbi:MAG: DEAD/DEAH box helicase family protein [Actinomycetota bacterium]